ncbi:hypothetical protein Lsan_3872 [Legionella santicrucis]|uniref:Uncharacterized protein n=1 Tax=Legionella santicrucis TaxID=45074 RepID=A0A0W0YA30_9GAMM|nr:hypothetical protein [Legionella santicrucis]KTD53462.1 hypothetical protein Lsan_3872 [Legionella santicrucis]
MSTHASRGMLLMFSRFFKVKQQPDYYELGGPRSYHKFRYQNTSVILIGEVHNPISLDLDHEYISIFNNYVANNRVILFLESDGTPRPKGTHGIDFMKSLEQLTPSPNLEMVFAEKRSEFCDEKYVYLWLFLEKIEDIEKSINHKKTKSHQTFSNTTEFMHSEALDDISLLYSQCCSFRELRDFLVSEITALDSMADKYINSNPQIYAFIGASILNVNEALGLLIELEEEYRSLQLEETNLEQNNLVSVCVEMMKKISSFKPASKLRDIYLNYLSSFHDATLLCDIWDRLEKNQEQSTLMVVMGDGHIERLSLLLKTIAIEEASIFADRKGRVIAPGTLDRFLKNNFEEALHQEKVCLVM